MAKRKKNVLSKPHAGMLHAFCACNYIREPLSRQHKASVFASRFTPSRHFQYKIGYNGFALSLFLLLIEIQFVFYYNCKVKVLEKKLAGVTKSVS